MTKCFVASPTAMAHTNDRHLLFTRTAGTDNTHKLDIFTYWYIYLLTYWLFWVFHNFVIVDKRLMYWQNCAKSTSISDKFTKTCNDQSLLTQTTNALYMPTAHAGTNDHSWWHVTDHQRYNQCSSTNTHFDEWCNRAALLIKSPDAHIWVQYLLRTCLGINIGKQIPTATLWRHQQISQILDDLWLY